MRPIHDFRVVAIVAAFNEADIIGQVVADLIDQDIEVYCLDDGSTDGTVAVVEPYLGRGVLAIERLSDTVPDREPGRFDWTRILERKAQIARTLDARWILHHDADEFRESPWAGVTMRDAIGRVDALGYNAIDFASFDFWPVAGGPPTGDDVREALPYCSPGALHDRVQIRAWKNVGDVDLASSGGHEARFDGRRVFPIRFIARHYPIRSQAHGERKVFAERLPRFHRDEIACGWHVQYGAVAPGATFLRDAATLTRFDADAVRLALTLCTRDIASIEGELARAREESADLARVVESLQQQVVDARLAGEALASAVEERDVTVAHLQDDLSGVLCRVAAIEASLSWRWTAPARAAYRLLKGGV